MSYLIPVETVTKIIQYKDAIYLLYPDSKIARETRCYTETSIGTVIEVEFQVILADGTELKFRFDVSDYSGW